LGQETLGLADPEKKMMNAAKQKLKQQEKPTTKLMLFCVRGVASAGQST